MTASHPSTLRSPTLTVCCVVLLFITTETESAAVLILPINTSPIMAVEQTIRFMALTRPSLRGHQARSCQLVLYGLFALAQVKQQNVPPRNWNRGRSPEIKRP